MIPEANITDIFVWIRPRKGSEEFPEHFQSLKKPVSCSALVKDQSPHLLGPEIVVTESTSKLLKLCSSEWGSQSYAHDLIVQQRRTPSHMPPLK